MIYFLFFVPIILTIRDGHLYKDKDVCPRIEAGMERERERESNVVKIAIPSQIKT